MKHFSHHHLLFNILITIGHGYQIILNIASIKVMSMKIHYRHYQSVYVMVWYVEKYLFELENKRRERERKSHMCKDLVKI